MRALGQHFKLRILAGVVLAVFGNSSAASDADVLKFKAASPVIRPQGRKTQKSSDPSEPGLAKTLIINTDPTGVATQPSVQQPVVQQPAPLAPPPVTTTAPPTIAAPPVIVKKSLPPPSAPPVTITQTPIAEPDHQTTAGTAITNTGGICPTGNCAKTSRTGGLETQVAQLKDVNDAMRGGTGDKDLLNKLAIAAVRDAVKGRSVAQFCGGGYRSGNRSKCMCASGVKEALRDSGACPSYLSGDAVNIAGLPHGTTDQLSRTGPNPSHALPALCPAFHQIKGRMPKLRDSLSAAENAPAGSVIVYSTSRHGYGHIETKIQVTAENIGSISKNLNVKLGQFLYCSDFCRTGPTFSHESNRVEAIYSL